MQITKQELAHHYAATRTLLRDYFPSADSRAIADWIAALRAFDLSPTDEVLNRIITAHHQIASSIPTIELDT